MKITLLETNKLTLIFIIVLTALIYTPTLNYEFYPNFDDEKLILNNTTVHNFPNNIKDAFTEFVFGLYHPLTTLSFSIDYLLFKTSPFGYRLHNLLLHLLNVLLVYIFVNNLTKNEFIALLSALVFSIHPMHIESVIWISERKDVLFLFYFLLGLISYQQFKVNNKKIWIVYSFLLFILSLLSKTTAVIFPMILLLIDYVYDKNISIKQIINKSLFFILSIFFGIINIKAQNSVEFIQSYPLNYGIINIATMPVYSFIYYITHLFVPVNLAAKHFYPKSDINFLPWFYYASWLFFVFIVWVVYRWRKNRLVVFGFIFYVLSILLVLKIVPTGNDIVSERYSYLPYIGLSIMIGSILFDYVKKLKYLFIIVLLLILSVTTFLQTKKWQNEITIWTNVLKYYPQSALSYNYRGIAYGNKNFYIKSLKDFNKAIEINPKMYAVYINRGLVYIHLKEYNKALNNFSVSILYDSLNVESYYNRGMLYYILNKYDKAIIDFEKCNKLEPGKFYVNNLLAISYYKVKNYEKSLIFFLKQAQDDNNIKTLNYIANIFVKINRYSDAIKYFDKIILLNPNQGSAYLNRGNAYYFLDSINIACENWVTAEKLGVKVAGKMIEKHCNKKKKQHK